MARTDNTKELTGELAKTKEELFAAGVKEVKAVPDTNLVEVFGIKGDYIVVDNDGKPVTDEDEKQKAVDLSLEHSRTQGDDPRHSDHEDHKTADGTLTNREASPSTEPTGSVEENPADASKNE